MTRHETVTLNRDAEGTAIPAGTAVFVPQGSVVTITQELGGSFTILTDHGYMVRIEAKDADALGKEPPQAPIETPLEPLSSEELEAKIWELLRTVYDPEIPVNIVDLGLVYRLELEPEENRFDVAIDMTMTAPGCGMGDVLAEDARTRIESIPNVNKAKVEIVWDPPWDQTKMSDAARLQLGMDY